MPLNVSGKSSVLPAVVICCVPDVPLKFEPSVPAETVMPDDTTKLPRMFLAALLNVPEKPEKPKFTNDDVPLVTTMSEPAVMFREIALAREVPIVRVPVLPE